MNKSVSDKKEKKPGTASEQSSPLDLPRLIAKQLKACVQSAGSPACPVDKAVKYLWIDLTDKRDAADKKKSVGLLSVHEWLNVVDESASLGACCLVICVGDSLSRYPHLWKICKWAQRVHGIDVGIHTTSPDLTSDEFRELKALDPKHTWLFVRREVLPKFVPLEESGMRVCASEVSREDHKPPCDMPEDIVFVGPEGLLYTCGLVLDDDRYRLGHVSEKPLLHILQDPASPRRIPANVPRHASGCDACPPLMAKRIRSGGR